MRSKISDVIANDIVNLTTTNDTYLYELSNMQSFVDTDLASSDAEVPKISKIKILIELGCTSPFAARVIMAQTAGAITSGSQATQHNLLEALDVACNDDIGFEPMTKIKQSQARMIYYNSSASHTWHMLNFEINLSPKLINLINREAQTERSQDLTACVILQGITTQSVGITWTISYEYKNIAKNISIR